MCTTTPVAAVAVPRSPDGWRRNDALKVEGRRPVVPRVCISGLCTVAGVRARPAATEADGNAYRCALADIPPDACEPQSQLLHRTLSDRPATKLWRHQPRCRRRRC